MVVVVEVEVVVGGGSGDGGTRSFLHLVISLFFTVTSTSSPPTDKTGKTVVDVCRKVGENRTI